MTKETLERWQITDFFYRHLPLILLRKQGTVLNNDLDISIMWELSSALALSPYCRGLMVEEFDLRVTVLFAHVCTSRLPLLIPTSTPLQKWLQKELKTYRTKIYNHVLPVGSLNRN